jgi:hypothetical protein
MGQKGGLVYSIAKLLSEGMASKSILFLISSLVVSGALYVPAFAPEPGR